jgi:ATP-binding cassette subfamily B protein
VTRDRSGRSAALRTAIGLTAQAAPVTTIGYLVTGALTAGAPVASALLLRILVNRLIAHDPLGTLVVPVTGIALCMAAIAGMDRIGHYLRNEMERRTGILADDRVYQAVNSLDGLARLEDPPFLDRIRMAQQAGAGVSALFVAGLLDIVFGVLAVSGYVGALLVLSPVLAAALTVTGIAMLFAELRLARGRAAAFGEVMRRQRRELFYGNLLVDSSAAKEIRLFGIGAFLRARMRTERVAANRRTRRNDQREARLISGLSLVSTAVSAAGLLWGVRAAVAGQVNVGDVTMFVQAVAGVQLTLASLVRQLATAQESLLALGHYVDVVGTGPDLTSPDVRPLPAMAEGILLRDVWFRYSPDARWVLRGVNLHLPHGRITGLVGKNGSGKSTLVKLICRFYDPDQGAIYWDGRDLRDIAPSILRERITAVFQDFMEYDLTFAENIAVGDIADLKKNSKIAEAAVFADIDSTARELPAGYATLLSRMFMTEEDKSNPETGVLLSGGQWQRIAVARAYFRGMRDLVILDEPSAGLDAEAEYRLQQGIRDQCAGQAVLLISHRLNTLSDAHQIVVLEDGRVVEQGAHHELVSADGAYARLFELQAKGYRMPGRPA